jgi:hypothetical protein
MRGEERLSSKVQQQWAVSTGRGDSVVCVSSRGIAPNKLRLGLPLEMRARRVDRKGELASWKMETVWTRCSWARSGVVC